MLQVRGLQVAIGRKVLCRHLDLDFTAGQCWGVLGRNGSGKTTLLRTLAGLCPPGRGRVLLDGSDLTRLGRRRVAQRLGLLRQEQQDRFPVPVLDTVLGGRYPHLGPWRWPGAQDLDLALQALEGLGLAGLAGRNVQTLSGGERQRVAIATLLAQSPQVLLLDEPVSHQDLAEQIRILGLLRALAARERTVIMSLHDLNQALRYCDHLLLLHRGRALAGTVGRIAVPGLLSRVFGQPLRQLDGPKGPLMVPR
jgi:iron complex transport system ATP-binding protein